MGCTCNSNDKEKLFCSGVLVETMPGAILPPKEMWEKKKGGYVVIECPQRIPCNPCATSCPTGAVIPFIDINDTPEIDYDKIDTIRGLDITITTTARTDEEGRALLTAFNFPFRN